MVKHTATTTSQILARGNVFTSRYGGILGIGMVSMGEQSEEGKA